MIKTKEKAIEAVKEVKNLKNSNARAEQRLSDIVANAKYDRDITKTANDKKVKELEKELKYFCQKNRPVLFAEKKSIGMGPGVVGFAFNPDKIKNMTGFKDADVIERLKENFTNYKDFIEIKESLRKQELKQIDDTDLSLACLRIERGKERFFVDTDNDAGRKD